MQKLLHNFKNLHVFSGKIENVQIPFKDVCDKNLKNFYEKIDLLDFVIDFPKSYTMLKSND